MFLSQLVLKKKTMIQNLVLNFDSLILLTFLFVNKPPFKIKTFGLFNKCLISYAPQKRKKIKIRGLIHKKCGFKILGQVVYNSC